MLAFAILAAFLGFLGQFLLIQGCTLRCSDGQSEPEPEPEPEPAPLLHRAPSFEKYI